MISVFITTDSGETSVHSFPVAEGMQFRVGRDECCEISLPRETYLSRVHCVISYTNGQLTIVDHQSSNGVFLNNQRIVSDFLVMDQPYRLGNCTMIVRETEGGEAMNPAPYAAPAYPVPPAVYPQQTTPPTQGFPTAPDYRQSSPTQGYTTQQGYQQPSPTQGYPAAPSYPQQQVPVYPQAYPQSYPQQTYPSSPYPAMQPYAQQGYVPTYGIQQGYPQPTYPMQGYTSIPQAAPGTGPGYPVQQQQAQMPIQGYEYPQQQLPSQTGYPTEYPQQVPQPQDFQQQQAYAQPAQPTYQDLPQACPQTPYDQQAYAPTFYEQQGYAPEPQSELPSSELIPPTEQPPLEEADESIEDMLARELEDTPESSEEQGKWDRLKTLIVAWFTQLLHWLKKLLHKTPPEEIQEEEEEMDDEAQQEDAEQATEDVFPSPTDEQVGDTSQEAPPQESSPEEPKS